MDQDNQQNQNIQNKQQAQQHADNLQNKIDDLNNKAQSSSGAEKQGFMAEIERLKTEKDTIISKINDWESKGKNFQDEAEGFLGKI